MLIRRVRGSSMRPALIDGDIVIVFPRTPRKNDLVLVRHNGSEIIKRVSRIQEKSYYIIGDNSQESTDSRHFGFVDKSDILGTVMTVLPKAVNPPSTVKPYGIWLGRVSAVLLIAMAITHLFRIDTFLPILDAVLPGNSLMATAIGFIIVLSEVFAIPFALRMKLSPLAHLLSGALLVLAPLWWLLITIWGYGLVETTGQLGQFANTPGDLTVLLLNGVWTMLSYGTLYALGYNQLKIKDLLRK